MKDLKKNFLPSELERVISAEDSSKENKDKNQFLEFKKRQETSIEALISQAFSYLKQLEFDSSHLASLARQAVGYGMSYLKENDLAKGERFLNKGIAYACEALTLREKELDQSFVVGEAQKLHLSLSGSKIFVGIFGEGGNSTCDRRPTFLNQLLTESQLVSSEEFKEDRDPKYPWLYQEFFKEEYQHEKMKIILYARNHGHGYEEYAEIVFASPKEAKEYFHLISNKLSSVSLREERK